MKQKRIFKSTAVKTLAVCAAVCAAVFTAAACSHGGSSGGGTGGGGGHTSVPYEFAAVPVPSGGITGTAPTYTMPGTQPFYKGVFIAGRTVTLSAYSIGKTEVTYNLWKAVYDWAVQPENGYKFANAGQAGSSTSGSGSEPVTKVTWNDCIIWCNAYTHKIKGEAECVYRKSSSDSTVLKNATDTAACNAAHADMAKKGFRLPTEAEWEYAARWENDHTNAEPYGSVWLTKLNSASGAKKPAGFQGLSLPSGESWESLRDELDRVAVYKEWYDGTTWVSRPAKTAAVARKAPNALGVYDMSGNAYEWCWDRHNATITAGNETDPQGASSGPNRVKRGGRCYDRATGCTVGSRGDGNPTSSDNTLGFRLACRP